MATRTYPFVSQMRLQAREEGLEEGLEKGEARGFANAILEVFDERGVEIDETSRERIKSCGDIEILGLWLRRSVVVTTVSDLFA